MRCAAIRIAITKVWLRQRDPFQLKLMYADDTHTGT